MNLTSTSTCVVVCVAMLCGCSNARIPSPAHPTSATSVQWTRGGDAKTGTANAYCSELAEAADSRANWRVAGGIILTALSAAAVAGTTAMALANDEGDSDKARQRRRIAAGVLPTVSVTAGGAATLLFVRSGDASSLAAAAARAAGGRTALTDCNEARATWSAGRAKAVSDYSEQAAKALQDDFEKRVKAALEKLAACKAKHDECQGINATTHAAQRATCDGEYSALACPPG